MDFKAIAERQKACSHEAVYYSPISDNFYCEACKKGMGQDYYDAHITNIHKGLRALSQAPIEDNDGD